MANIYDLVQQAKVGKSWNFGKLLSIRNMYCDLGKDYNELFTKIAFYAEDNPKVKCDLCGLMYKERPMLCLYNSNVFLSDLQN